MMLAECRRNRLQILAENGLIGFSFFLFMILSYIIWVKNKFKKIRDSHLKLIAFSFLLISTGLYIELFTDALNISYYWLIPALAAATIKIGITRHEPIG